MNRMTGGVAAVMLAGVAVLSRCHHPTPSAAAVEFAPGTVAGKDQELMQELVAAFDRAEAAVQQADLAALMRFYAKEYNYHGLKQADVRRVWHEVFSHYRDIRSKHLFTEWKLGKQGNRQQALVTCTGGLYGSEKETGKPITIDNWVNEVHFLVKENGEWKFLGNAGGIAPEGPPASAPHHPLF